MRLRDQTRQALSAGLRFHPQGNGQPQQVIYRRVMGSDLSPRIIAWVSSVLQGLVGTPGWQSCGPHSGSETWTPHQGPKSLDPPGAQGRLPPCKPKATSSSCYF